MRRLFFALLACLAISPAWAGSSSLNYAPSGSSGMRVTTDGTTNCTGATACNLNNITVWDQSAGANGWGILANNAGKMDLSSVAGTAITNVPTAVGTAGTGNTPTFNSYLVGCISSVCPTLGPAAASASSPTVLPILQHTSGASASLTSLVVKNAASNLAGFNCTAISGAAAGFCIAYNGSAAPATGALTAANVLDFCFFDTTARGCSLAHINGAVAYSTGITVLISTAATPYTYTTGTATGAITGDYY